MIKGIYTAAAGMMLQMARQDVVANNIANVNTAGFKKDTALCQAFPQMLISRLGEVERDATGREKSMTPVPIGGLGTGAVVDSVFTDYSQGNIRKTDNPTDLAISNNTGSFNITTPEGEEEVAAEGSLYFVVRMPDGAERFTRNGCFKINNEGILTTSQGYEVLDTDDNPITIDSEFSINNQGEVIIEGEIWATLKIAHFRDSGVLQKVGDSWSSNQPYNQVHNPQILQGYMEESNVNAVKEMVNLITVVRAYESLQKIVQSEDETMQVAIDQVGSVR